MGRTMVVVANRNPTTLMGVGFQRKVLIAGGSDVITILTVDDPPWPGYLDDTYLS